MAFLSKSMYITDSNQYAIELVTYLLVLVVYFYEFIVYMLLERNAYNSIAFFSQCNFNHRLTSRFSVSQKGLITNKISILSI